MKLYRRYQAREIAHHYPPDHILTFMGDDILAGLWSPLWFTVSRIWVMIFWQDSGAPYGLPYHVLADAGQLNSNEDQGTDQQEAMELGAKGS